MEKMIHKFECNGYYMVLDVASGGVYVLDRLAYRLLDYIQPPMQTECPESALKALGGEYSREEILESYQELYQLYENEQLFVEEDYEKYAGILSASPIKSMCLNVAHDCNLRCSYCFASTGDFGAGRKLMPEEVGKKALDFLVEHSKGRHNLEVDFFGGEPLMNFEVVKKLVAMEDSWRRNMIRISALLLPPTVCYWTTIRSILSIVKCPTWFCLLTGARK